MRIIWFQIQTVNVLFSLLFNSETLFSWISYTFSNYSFIYNAGPLNRFAFMTYLLREGLFFLLIFVRHQLKHWLRI